MQIVLYSGNRFENSINLLTAVRCSVLTYRAPNLLVSHHGLTGQCFNYPLGVSDLSVGTN